MTDYLDFAIPAGARARGIVLVVPGRGESPAGYTRFGSRLAADAYQARVLPAPVIDPADLDATLSRLAATLAHAAAELGADGSARPLALVGADTGAAALAALIARSDADAAWWPAGVVLAGLPGYVGHHADSWDDELDARTHCSVHRGVLSNDPAFQPGALAEPAPAQLLDAAYGDATDLPHLLLAGDADPLGDPQALARLAKALPSARLTTVRGAHHDVLNDQQHRSVAAEVVTFLEALRDGSPLTSITQVVHSDW